MHGSVSSAPGLTGLTHRADFRLGTTSISPASREVSGPGGTVPIEPRVMQVLCALSDARGAVVTREALLESCWSGLLVGDDALNRAIGEVRRVARSIADGGFTVETIPKTGYRLLVDEAVQPALAAVSTRPSRRALLIGGAAALAGTGALLAWRMGGGSADDEHAAELLTRGRLAMRDALPESDAQGVGFLEQAVALAPGNAAAWGALALAWRNTAEFSDTANVAAATASAEQAARRALAIDRRQGDALTALATLPPPFGAWVAAEQRLTQVLAIAPGNAAAIDALGILKMGTGQVRARLRIAEQLAAREPLSPIYQMHLIYGLWGTGRNAEADRAAARAYQLWPSHPAIWMARLWTFAFNGKAPAALELVNEAQRAQAAAKSRVLAGLATSMRALASRSPADIAAAVDVNLAAARLGGPMAVNAILVLAGLGALDAAFAVTDGYLLQRGPVVVAQSLVPGQPQVNDQRHRKTMMLFTGATRPMRADQRFMPLCRDIGLVDYWWQTSNRPDFLEGRPVV